MIPSSKARNPSLRKARERKISRNCKIPCHNVNALVTKEATRKAERSSSLKGILFRCLVIEGTCKYFPSQISYELRSQVIFVFYHRILLASYQHAIATNLQ